MRCTPGKCKYASKPIHAPKILRPWCNLQDHTVMDCALLKISTKHVKSLSDMIHLYKHYGKTTVERLASQHIAYLKSSTSRKV